jgi:nucleotide-binding universal stress UspA family protein
MAKVIVVGADGSEGSQRALEVELARDIGAEIRAVHVESRVALWEFSAIQIDIDP